MWLKTFSLLGTLCWIWNSKKGCCSLRPVRKKPRNCRCPLWKESRCPQGHETVQRHPTWWYGTWSAVYFILIQLVGSVVILIPKGGLWTYSSSHHRSTHSGDPCRRKCRSFKMSVVQVFVLTGFSLAFLVEAVVSWTEIVVEALEVCRKPVGDVAQAVPEEGVEVAEEGPTSSSFQQKNSMLS